MRRRRVRQRRHALLRRPELRPQLGQRLVLGLRRRRQLVVLPCAFAKGCERRRVACEARSNAVLCS